MTDTINDWQKYLNKEMTIDYSDSWISGKVIKVNIIDSEVFLDIEQGNNEVKSVNTKFITSMVEDEHYQVTTEKTGDSQLSLPVIISIIILMIVAFILFDYFFLGGDIIGNKVRFAIRMVVV